MPGKPGEKTQTKAFDFSTGVEISVNQRLGEVPQIGEVRSYGSKS